MRQVAEEHLPAFRTLRPTLYPSYWDSHPFAENLWRAAQGNFGNPDLSTAGCEIVSSNLQPSQRKYYEVFLDKQHRAASHHPDAPHN